MNKNNEDYYDPETAAQMREWIIEKIVLPNVKAVFHDYKVNSAMFLIYHEEDTWTDEINGYIFVV